MSGGGDCREQCMVEERRRNAAAAAFMDHIEILYASPFYFLHIYSQISENAILNHLLHLSERIILKHSSKILMMA